MKILSKLKERRENANYVARIANKHNLKGLRQTITRHWLPIVLGTASAISLASFGMDYVSGTVQDSISALFNPVHKYPNISQATPFNPNWNSCEITYSGGTQRISDEVTCNRIQEYYTSPPSYGWVPKALVGVVTGLSAPIMRNGAEAEAIDRISTQTEVDNLPQERAQEKEQDLTTLLKKINEPTPHEEVFELNRIYAGRE